MHIAILRFFGAKSTGGGQHLARICATPLGGGQGWQHPARRQARPLTVQGGEAASRVYVCATLPRLWLKQVVMGMGLEGRFRGRFGSPIVLGLSLTQWEGESGPGHHAAHISPPPRGATRKGADSEARGLLCAKGQSWRFRGLIFRDFVAIFRRQSVTLGRYLGNGDRWRRE